jgi:uncharacterized repeat protein (TIGR01451 family)
VRLEARAKVALALALVVAAAVAAASGFAADPDVSAVASDAPDPVTAGLTVVYTFALVNDDQPTLTNTAFASVLPAGAVFVSASFATTEPSSGACAASAGTVTCGLGHLRGGADASVEVRFLAPPSDFQSCGSFSFKEGTSEGDASHLDTVSACDSTQVRSATDPNFRGGCIDAGQSLSTGSTATATDRQNTTVTVADGACVIVSEVSATSATEACGAGFTCTTEISDVLLPSCSVTAPCRVTLTFDKLFGKVRRVFKDDVLVAPCTNPTVAAPDPCVVSMKRLGNRDTRFELNFGVDARLRGG